MPEKVVRFTHTGRCDLCGAAGEVFYAPVPLEHRAYSCCLNCMRKRTARKKAGNKTPAPPLPYRMSDEELLGYIEIDDAI